MTQRNFVSSKKGGRGHVSIKHSIDTWIGWFEYYIKIEQRKANYRKKHKGSSQKKKNITRINRTTITWKNLWVKQLYISRDKQEKFMKIWTWLKKGNFMREPEYYQTAAQNNAIRSNYVKAKVDQTKQNNRCRLRGERNETIGHIRQYNKLMKSEYKTRYDLWGKWSIENCTRNLNLTIRTTWNPSWIIRYTNFWRILRYKRIT